MYDYPLCWYFDELNLSLLQFTGFIYFDQVINNNFNAVRLVNGLTTQNQWVAGIIAAHEKNPLLNCTFALEMLAET